MKSSVNILQDTTVLSKNKWDVLWNTYNVWCIAMAVKGNNRIFACQPKKLFPFMASLERSMTYLSNLLGSSTPNKEQFLELGRRTFVSFATALLGSLLLYVRWSHLAPTQPGRHWHVPMMWSQWAAFLHSHTWWQSTPKNPAGQAKNGKKVGFIKSSSHFFTQLSGKQQTPALAFWKFCTWENF